MNDMSKLKIIITVLVIILSIFCSCLIYFAGFEPRETRNKNYIKTNCIIDKTYTVKNLCTYTCNCVNVCIFFPNCILTCDTCYYDCYNGYMIYIYYDDATYSQNSLVYENYRDISSLNINLNKNYKLGTKFSCYYNSKNPSDVKFELEQTLIYLILFSIFVGLGILVILIYLFCRVRNCYTSNST